ncbi:MAG: glutamyl-tRNA reductase [Firmicutes bacterium]|nr:glutamyl-tRNA reductase [Bacillota bacterium]
MQLLCVSISHEKAPISVRERVSFTKKKQAEILKYIKQNIADECVILSTCNRCEFYLAGGDCKKTFLNYLVSLVGGFVADYITVYENDLCCEHLMLTAAGLKSMILGEDQILGQVKDARGFSSANLCCGKYLNTLFRLAVTGAKKVKTETLLSKTPLSAATISIKLCRNILGTLNNKNILIIGASGKTGSIVLKDLLSLGNVNIYATARTRGGGASDNNGAVSVEYEKRYDNLDIYDAVISATSSPHLTLERDKIASAIKTCKTRVFIDLAVPRDIEVAQNESTIYKNIDDLLEIADGNNKIKQKEIKKAQNILKKYTDEFRVWKLFTENEPLFEYAENKIENNGEKYKFRHKIYDLKAENDYARFYEFVTALKEKSYEY